MLMTRSLAAGLCLVLLPALAASPASAQDFPFTGIVTDADVPLHAGAGQNYYEVGNVAKGTILKVHDNLYGWYKIDPPAGTFSYISKDFVKVGADGAAGVVTGQRVRVRAPAPGGPDKSYRTQLMLNDGDPVKVVGESGEFYKIVPPGDATLFIKKEFVRQATADEIAAAAKPDRPVTPEQPPVTPERPVKPEPIVVTANADGSADILGDSYGGDDLIKAFKALAERGTPVIITGAPTLRYEQVEPVLKAADASGIRNPTLKGLPTKPEVAVVPVPPIKPVTPDTPDKPAPEVPIEQTASPALAELELRFRDITKQPVTQQPIATLKMDYEKLLAGGELEGRDESIAKARVDALATRQELQNSLKEIEAVKKQLADARKRDAEIEAARPRSYTAVGRLVASTLYTGDKLPLLHRIVDPLTGLTIAYVRPGADLRLADLIGQYVGVMGDKEYDPALKLQIINASAIDALTPQGR